MPSETETFEVLTTAEQAWPAFEEAVLDARDEISAGFRIFDFATKLRSERAREIGDTWTDLIIHVVSRGVHFRLILSDFDPVMATALHEGTWRTIRQAVGIAEILGPKAAARFSVVPALHPAQAGTLPRLAFLPHTLRKLRHTVQRMNPARLRRQAVGIDPREVPQLNTVTHHQKLAVIDCRVLYIGGLDLNERRFDTPRHERPAHKTWSDLQLLVTGPAAKEAAHHLDTFLSDVARRKVPERSGRAIRRTLSAQRTFGFWALSPRTLLNEIERDHLDAFASARHLIYLETQFFRSTVLARALGNAARDRPELSLIAILPALPENVAFENSLDLDARYGMALQKECLDRITDAFGPRACIATPVQKRLAARDSTAVLAGSPVIYVHNKALIADDAFAMVGSANLNGRSMRWDTEAALRIERPAHVAQLWRAVNEHWWDGDTPAEARAPETAAAWWRQEIARNNVRNPDRRRGFLIPHDPDNMGQHVQPLPGVTENIV